LRIVTDEAPIEIGEALNPRGGLAKELETTCKRASWLSLLCAHWLAHHNDNADNARLEEPTYKLPKALKGAGRINKAFQECGAHKGRSLKGGFESSHAYRWDWAWVFDYWYSGGLDRDIKILMSMLPSQNVKAIERELLK